MREIYMVPEIISEAAGGKIVQEISKVQATTLGMVTAGIVQGTGDNFGGGWRQDSSGNWHGTGSNFGKGWRER